MPQFTATHSVLSSGEARTILCHTADGAQTFEPIDLFCLGYLKCAEWLYPEDEPEAEGWSQAAILAARKDCDAFQDAQALLLERFSTITGRDDESCGHDYWLTRNGHGTGFWDRGAGECGEQLSEACRNDNVDIYAGDDGFLYFM